MTRKIKDITICGAGLVGSLLGIYLARRGYNVKIFERRSDLRLTGAEGGRSINLALSNRGWKSLEETGVIKEVKKMVIPMKGRMIHSEEGEISFQPYGKEGQAINSISRSGLNKVLMNKAESEGVQIFFECKCLDVEIENTRLTYEKDGRTESINSDLIIGADGAFSAVRNSMMTTDKFNYSQYFIEHGYKELTIPAGDHGEFLLEKNALHIWPRGNFMLIALPNKDASFTVTLFLPFEGENSFALLRSEKKMLDFFKKNFPDAVPLLSDLKEEFYTNPTSSLVTIKCYPWVKNNLMLIGDAAHALVPFYGQGMNAGFEDCRILDHLIEDHGGNWDLVLKHFQENRKPDADAISELALRNFIEMRDLVADKDFLLRKEIESHIHKLYPKDWIPQYSMVTFCEDMRYSEAKRKGEIQKKLMDGIMDTPGIHEQWKHLDFDKIVKRYRENFEF